MQIYPENLAHRSKASITSTQCSPIPFKTYDAFSDLVIYQENRTEIKFSDEISDSSRSHSLLNPVECRICYEVGTESGPLQSYCQCIGSLKYVHEVCLNEWLTVKFPSLEGAACELCCHNYSFEIIHSRRVNMLKGKALRKQAYYAALYAASLIVLALTIYVLVSYYFQEADSSTEEAEALAFIGLCSLSAISVIFIAAVKIRKLFRNDVSSWRLLPFCRKQEQLVFED